MSNSLERQKSVRACECRTSLVESFVVHGSIGGAGNDQGRHGDRAARGLLGCGRIPSEERPVVSERAIYCAGCAKRRLDVFQRVGRRIEGRRPMRVDPLDMREVTAPHQSASPRQLVVKEMRRFHEDLGITAYAASVRDGYCDEFADLPGLLRHS